MIWAILLLATILRLININQSLWLDEASQVLMSQKSIYSIIFERAGDFHPPLSYILYHYWVMAGSSEVWLRLLPVIFGAATVFVVYKITEKLWNKKIALLSVLLLAVAPYHVYYSQEIRMYSIATFFASLSMYYFVTSKPIGYILATATLLYTHYMGIFLIIAQALYFLITQKKEFLNYSKLLLGIFLIYLLWIPQLMTQLTGGLKVDQYLPGWGSLLSLEPVKAIPLTFLKFSIGRIDFENIYLYGVLAAVVLVFYGFLLIKAWSEKIKLIWFWLFIPIILSWVISFILPINQPFRLLFVLPAFYILLAVGIFKMGRFWILGLFGVFCISISGVLIYYSNPKFQREDWRSATRDIPTNAVFAWPVPFDPYIWYGGKGIGAVKNFPATVDNVAQNLGDAKLGNQVYVFEYLQGLSDPQKNIQQTLVKNGYKLLQRYNFNGVGFVDLYQK